MFILRDRVVFDFCEISKPDFLYWRAPLSNFYSSIVRYGGHFYASWLRGFFRL